MEDVVLDAKLDDIDLLASIDSTLKRSETKFDDFANNINTILGNIGSNVGNKMSDSFSGQIDAMSAKIKVLEEQISSLGTVSPNIKTNDKSVSINMNDYNSMLMDDLPLQKLKEMQKNLSAYRSQLTENTAELKLADNMYSSIVNRIKQAKLAESKINLGNTFSMPEKSLSEVESKLKSLKEVQQSMSGKSILSVQDLNKVDSKIGDLQSKIEKFKFQAVSSPLKISDVIGMSEKNINEISMKMRAISSLRGNFAQGSPELLQLNNQYNKN